MDVKPSFYALIPANVRYDAELTPNAKLLYAEITSLTNDRGYCWATNEYFANLYGVSKRSISTWVNQLKDKGYIDVRMINKKGTKEIEARYITIKINIPDFVKDDVPIEENFHTPGKNLLYPIEENFHTPIEENFQENNKVSNIKINNKKDIYVEVVSIYHEICISLAKVIKISDKRKKQILNLYKLLGNDLEKVKEYFSMIESSDFLTGRIKNWSADFDWILKEEHMIKILEGAYKNKGNGITPTTPGKKMSKHDNDRLIQHKPMDWDELDRLEQQKIDDRIREIENKKGPCLLEQRAY